MPHPVWSAPLQAGVLFVMTHDSIGLGEDGPTHQVGCYECCAALPPPPCWRCPDHWLSSKQPRSTLTHS